MTISTSGHCKRCGAAVSADSTEALCPACLLSGALEPPGDETVTLAAGRSPAVSIEPAEFPRPFGSYRLLGLLGTGGMGRVYEAVHLASGRRVALKMLAQQLDSGDMRQRFLREGRLAASVSHPNSLYVYGSEEIEGIPVITMEIAGSGTLKDRLAKRGPFPTKAAVDAILQVISGLEAAHAGGVLHRDVKPSNCFLGPDDHVKVGDFGLSVSTLAKEDSYATATGVIMGTPAYAPPEQLRGDDLDVRADIYSVGATLFTLLTGRAPFEGKNAVQVVANAMNRKPTSVRELRANVPPGLERVVARCLAKEPAGRYDDYIALRNALLPFSSREPEPAPLKVRVAAGWVDYLIAFLVPYVLLMLAVGNEEFHLRLFLDRTLYAARYHIAFLCCGILYFTLAEGIWGHGVGKWLKGLRVLRTQGRPAGPGRALIRILVPVLAIEGVRIPLLLATLSARQLNDMTGFEAAIYSIVTSIVPFLPVAFMLRARRDNGYATTWDLLSGTRVVFQPQESVRAAIDHALGATIPTNTSEAVGPFRVVEEMIPGKWLVAVDPVLRRPAWLLRRETKELSVARRNLARPGRPRWLQRVERAGVDWDAFEASRGVPFRTVLEGSRRLPWATLRPWLHDLACELWAAEGDATLPSELSLDHVWITSHGQAILLDEPWPGFERPAERIAVGDVAGQQRFLHAVAACVETTGLPFHARPVLQNLKERRFEKLSFLTGTLRGILGRPAEVSRGIRAGSIFLLPVYVWIMVFIGTFRGEGEWLSKITGNSAASFAMIAAMLVLGGAAMLQLLQLPFRTTFGQGLFQLAVVNADGERATAGRLLGRWAIVWLPLIVPMSVIFLSVGTMKDFPPLAAWPVLLLWIAAAAHAVLDPHRGLPDRLSGTWVVRR